MTMVHYQHLRRKHKIVSMEKLLFYGSWLGQIRLTEAAIENAYRLSVLDSTPCLENIRSIHRITDLGLA